MRRGMIMWIAVAVMLSQAVPAGAKGKPDKPDRPPEGQGKTCAALVANGAVWDLGERDLNGVYSGFIGNGLQHGGVCIDLEPLEGIWTVSWTIDIPPRSDLRGIMMVFSKGWGFSADRYDELEVRDPTDQPLPWTWTTAVVPESDVPFVFVAMSDIKRAKGDWSISFTVTPPKA